MAEGAITKLPFRDEPTSDILRPLTTHEKVLTTVNDSVHKYILNKQSLSLFLGT